MDASQCMTFRPCWRKWKETRKIRDESATGRAKLISVGQKLDSLVGGEDVTTGDTLSTAKVEDAQNEGIETASALKVMQASASAYPSSQEVTEARVLELIAELTVLKEKQSSAEIRIHKLESELSETRIRQNSAEISVRELESDLSAAKRELAEKSASMQDAQVSGTGVTESATDSPSWSSAAETRVRQLESELADVKKKLAEKPGLLPEMPEMPSMLPGMPEIPEMSNIDMPDISDLPEMPAAFQNLADSLPLPPSPFGTALSNKEEARARTLFQIALSRERKDWGLDAAPTDIGRDTFVQVVQDLLAAENEEPRDPNQIGAVFDAYDVDRNGRLDEEEFLVLLAKIKGGDAAQFLNGVFSSAANGAEGIAFDFDSWASGIGFR